MRVLILALLFSLFSYSQDVTVIHFNYKWNENNSYRGLDRLRSAKISYAYVEDQKENIQKSIKSVPTIQIYKGQTPVARFEAGLSMKITVSLDSIQSIINKHNGK
tara:strand:+ start:611 stop:925 length:315 start_codon:yes stop_codon:yes gene_type:complete